MKGIPKVHQPAKRRRGVTLIEAVLYISVALALIVGGLVFYQQAAFQSRMNSVVRTYSALIAEARTMTGEGPILGEAGFYFENLLYARGAVPAELWDATKPPGERLRLPFPNMSATLGVELAADGTSTIVLFQQNMPVNLCSRLFVVSRRDTRYANGAFGVAYFSDEVSGGPSVSHVIEFFPSISPAQAGTYCRSADANGNGLVRTEIVFRTFD